MPEITLQVDKEALQKTLETVQRKSSQMLEILQGIKETVLQLQGTWASEAGDEIRAAIDAMQQRFDDYKAVTDSYAAFLEKTMDTYFSLETKLTSDASAFKSAN